MDNKVVSDTIVTESEVSRENLVENIVVIAAVGALPQIVRAKGNVPRRPQR